jgi:dipeptidyl-peptidase-4
VKTADGKKLGTLAGQDVGNYNAEGVINDLFPIQTKSGSLNALLTRPSVIQEGKRYPVLIIVYGGPHVQLAKNRYHPVYQPMRDLLAKRGVLVFTVDGRGSDGRGHDFETAIRLSLGRLELEDQLAGVKYLKSLPFVDPERIGIFGWSYGGYMALSALLRSDVFAMGIAVAPVTDWLWYDSAYTERYMQRPSDNPEGYRAAALPPVAAGLNAPLLLVHGISDTNVHFTHSRQMFEALTLAHKDFESIFFPGKDHKLGGPAARVHLFERMLLFIKDNL